jgi:hypothetical protein
MPIALYGKEIQYTPKSTPEFTGGSSGSMIIDDDFKVVGINFAGVVHEKTNTSVQGFGLFLNTNNKNKPKNDEFFGTNDKYNVFED